MIIAIITYSLIVIITMLTLNKISINKSKRINQFIYGGTGGVVGGISHNFLTGSTGILSLIEHSINGDFSYFGWYFLASLVCLFMVFAYNFMRYDGVAVR